MSWRTTMKSQLLTHWEKTNPFHVLHWHKVNKEEEITYHWIRDRLTLKPWKPSPVLADSICSPSPDWWKAFMEHSESSLHLYLMKRHLAVTNQKNMYFWQRLKASRRSHTGWGYLCYLPTWSSFPLKHLFPVTCGHNRESKSA